MADRSGEYSQDVEPLDLPEIVGVEDVPVAPSPVAAPARPRSLRLTADERARILTQVRTHYQDALDTTDELQQRREERYQRYLGDLSLREGRQPWEDAERFFDPLTRSTLEHLQEAFMAALLPTYETIKIRGIGADDIQKAQIKTQYYRWYLDQVVKLRETLNAWIFDALLDEIGYLKVYPYEDVYVNDNEVGQQLKRQVRMETIDAGNLLIDPVATSLQYPSCRYIHHRLYINPLDEFPVMRRQGFDVPRLNVEDMEDLVGYGSDTVADSQERERLTFERSGIFPQYLHDGLIEMVESYEVVTIGNNRRVFVVVSWFPEARWNEDEASDEAGMLGRVAYLEDVYPQTTMIRKTWPFFPLTIWPQPRQLRGMSVADRLESQQDALNALIEQMVHSGRIGMLPYYFYTAALTGDLPDLNQIRPGQGVPIDPGGTVTFAPHRSDNAHYLQQRTEFKRMAEEDTGVTSIAQGRASELPNVPRTTSGIALLLQQGQKTNKEHVLRLGAQLQEALQFGFSLLQTLMPAQATFFVPGSVGGEATLEERLFPDEDFLDRKDITQEEVSGIFDLSVDVNPDALLEQQKMLVAAENLDKHLQGIWPQGQYELLKDTWERLGLKNFDRFYPKDVAAIQTQIRVLQGQILLAQLEAQVRQLSAPPGPPQGQGVGGEQDLAGLLQALGGQGGPENGASPGQAASGAGQSLLPGAQNAIATLGA